MTVARLGQLSGLFLLNCAVALLGTAMLASGFRIAWDSKAITASLLKETIVDGAVAFGLGYFVYRRWQWASSRWVWLAGLAWFGQRVIGFYIEQHGPLNALHGSIPVFGEMSGSRCASDSRSCIDWIVYTLAFLRTAFYSAGAFFCSWFKDHESTALPAVKKAILALRR
jgi:hypothetical protein